MTTRRRAALAALLLCPLLLAAPAPAPAGEGQGSAANEAGVALYRAGRFAEAAERFREAIAADPGREAPRQNLAAALASLAERDLREGRFEPARERLEEAVDLHERPAFRALLSGLHLARGELYEARREAERAVALAPDDPAALEALGDADYREGYLDRARRSWEQARAAGGPRAAALAAKLERLGREAEAERRFDRDVSAHFTVQYDGTVTPEVARAVIDALEEAYDRLFLAFGRAPRQDLAVILTSRVLFREVTGSADWVGGSYDGKIRVPVGGLRGAADAARLAPILAHELTHAFLRANVGGRLPLWFEEGLAEHFEGARPEAARARLGPGTGRFPTLAAIDAGLRSGADVEGAYAAAFLAIDQLVAMDGLWLPRRIVELVGEGTPFPEAFRRGAGIDLAEFEERRRSRR